MSMIRVENITFFIGRDVHALDPELTLVDAAPAVLQVYAPLPDGLDLRPHQDDAGLKAFLYKVFMSSLSVHRNGL